MCQKCKGDKAVASFTVSVGENVSDLRFDSLFVFVEVIMMTSSNLHFFLTEGGIWCAEIPAALRSRWTSSMVAIFWKNRSIRICYKQDFMQFSERVQAAGPEYEKRLRVVFRYAHDCYDGGLLSLSEELLHYAGITADAVLWENDGVWFLIRSGDTTVL